MLGGPKPAGGAVQASLVREGEQVTFQAKLQDPIKGRDDGCLLRFLKTSTAEGKTCKRLG